MKNGLIVHLFVYSMQSNNSWVFRIPDNVEQQAIRDGWEQSLDIVIEYCGLQRDLLIDVDSLKLNPKHMEGQLVNMIM